MLNGTNRDYRYFKEKDWFHWREGSSIFSEDGWAEHVSLKQQRCETSGAVADFRSKGRGQADLSTHEESVLAIAVSQEGPQHQSGIQRKPFREPFG